MQLRLRARFGKFSLAAILVGLGSCGGHQGSTLASKLDAQSLAPADSLKILFFGDSGKGNDEQLLTAQAMTRHCASHGCDMALLLGDNIYPDGVTSVDDPQFETKFEQPYKDLNFIFHVVLGNHDMHSGPAGMRAEIEYSKVSRKWRMPDRYYSFKAGAAEFFALDTNTYRHDSAQASWLSNALNESQAKWKIVMGHHPLYSTGNHGYLDWAEGKSQLKLRKALQPLLCKHKVLYLSGHEHMMQLNALPCGVTSVVAGAAAERKTPYANKIEDQKDTLRYYSTDSLGFGYATVSEDELKLTFISEDNQVLFRYDVNQPSKAQASQKVNADTR